MEVAATMAGESHPITVPMKEERPSSSVVVLLMCGLPASGKSSLAKRVREQVQVQSKSSNNLYHANRDRFRISTCHLIEYDALQESLLADGDTDTLEAWRQTRSVALQDFQRVLTECVTIVETTDVHELSLSSSLVILDDNFHLPSMRKQVYQTCQKVVASHVHVHDNSNSSVHVYFGIVYVDTPVELCLERNQQRQRHGQRAQGVMPVPNDVIRKMQDTLQPPPVPNAFWEQAAAVLHFDGSNETEQHDKVQRVLEFAATLWQQQESKVPPPVDPAVEQERLAAERKRTAASIAHLMDQSLRQLVSVVAQVRPAAASHANRMRQACLQQAKKEQLAKCNPDHSATGTGDDSVSAALYAAIAIDYFIEQVLQWQDWTDDEKLDVKDRLSRSAAELLESGRSSQMGMNDR
jgi:tRNA uridine 5-carbamoylmethylation protein Kti12